MADAPEFIPYVPEVTPPARTNPLAQFGAGVATIPSELVRAAGMVANPARTYRQVTGQTIPEDSQRSLSQVLETQADRWNSYVNSTVGEPEQNPSVLDDTGSAFARLAGGAVVSGPLRGLTTVASHLPAAARWGGRALELLTPTTVTNATGAAKVGQIAANVGVQGLAGGAIEGALTNDPTQPTQFLGPDGTVESEFIPYDSSPDFGRMVSNNVTAAVRDNPVASGVGAALAGAGAVLLARRVGIDAASRANQAASNLVGPTTPAVPMAPVTRTPLEVPGTSIDIPGTAPIREAGNRVAEVWSDHSIPVKDALQQALPANDPRLGGAQAILDAQSDTSHVGRVQAAMEQGIIHTPNGTVTFEPPARIWEDLAHADTASPGFRTKVEESLEILDELDNRNYNLKNRNMVDLDTTVQAVDPITKRPLTNADGTPIFEKITVPARPKFPDIGDTELEKRAVSIRSNPELMKWVNRVQDVYRKTIQVPVKAGYITAREAQLERMAHPNYIHTMDPDFVPKNPQAPRALEHGQLVKAASPGLAMDEYMHALMASMYKNRARNEVLDALLDAQKNNPNLPKWIGRNDDPAEIALKQVVVDPATGQTRPMRVSDLPNLPNSLKINRRVNGRRVVTHINAPEIHRVMELMPTHAKSWIGSMRGVAESFTTGKGSLAVGQMFAPLSGVMSAPISLLNQTKKYPLGPLSRAMSKATGGKVSFRGDPLAYPGMLLTAGMDMSAVGAKHLSRALANSIAHNGLLSKIIPNAQAVADRAAQAYAESNHAAMARYGAGNVSQLGNNDFDMGRNTTLGGYAPQYNVTRAEQVPKTLTAMLAAGARKLVPSEVRNTMYLVDDILSVMGNVANSYAFKTGRGKEAAWVKQAEDATKAYKDIMDTHVQPLFDQIKNEQQAILNIRRTAQHTATNNPAVGYIPNRQQIAVHNANIKALRTRAEPHLQQASKYEALVSKANNQAFREMTEVASMSRGIVGDPGMMGSALRNRGKNSKLSVEGAVGLSLEATPYANIGVQAVARLMKSFKDNPLGTTAALGMVMGPMVLLPLANAIRLDDKRRARGEDEIFVNHFLGRQKYEWGRRLEIYMDNDDPNMRISLPVDPQLAGILASSLSLVLDVTGIAGGSRDALSSEPREVIKRMTEARANGAIRAGWMNAQPFTQFPPVVGAVGAAMGFKVPDVDTLAGRGGGSMISTRGKGNFGEDRTAGEFMSRRWQEVITQLLGSTGATIAGVTNSFSQAERLQPGAGASAATDTARGMAADRAIYARPLYDVQAKRGTANGLSDAVQSKEDMFRRIAENMDAVNTPGTIGSGTFRRRADGAGVEGVADQQMREVLSSVSRFWQYHNSGSSDIGRRKLLQDQKADLNTQGLDYRTLRARSNEIDNQLNTLNQRLLSRYMRIENDLSRRTGYRIQLERIDPMKPITQFERLQ